MKMLGIKKVVPTYATFNSKVPSMIRKHFIKGSNNTRIDFSWAADINIFLSKLQIIFENFSGKDTDKNIGYKYLNYAAKVFKKNYYKDRYGIQNNIKKEDLKEIKYLFQDNVDKDEFYDLVKNRPNRERDSLQNFKVKYFDKMTSK